MASVHLANGHHSPEASEGRPDSEATASSITDLKRWVLHLGPLQILRTQVDQAAKDDTSFLLVKEWLDIHIPKANDVIVSRDGILPQVAYKVQHHLSDRTMFIYCTLLSDFPTAGQMFKETMDKDLEQYWKEHEDEIMASIGFERGTSMLEFLRKQLRENNLL